MKTANLFAAVMLLAAPLAAAAATTIADGSFETKGAALPVTDYCYDAFASPGGPACAPGAWTGNGVIRSGSGAWGGTTTPTGDYYGFVQGSSVLSQSFTATDTSSYVLSWADANRTNNGGIQSYVVAISDGVTTTGLGTYSGAFGSFAAKASGPFVLAEGKTYTLSFTGVFSDDRTSFIDNVSIGAVPEPTTWAMLVAGFGMVGFALRRRKVAVAA